MARQARHYADAVRLLERYRAGVDRLLRLGRPTGGQAALLDEYATTIIGQLDAAK